MRLSIQTDFPSQDIIGRIKKLKAVNASPTIFIDKPAEEIARYVITNLEGSMTIDVSKADPVERQKIRDAAHITIDGKKPNITILGDHGDEILDHEGFTEEDNILRKLNEEILGDTEGINIGRSAFRLFIKTLIENSEYYPLIRDEWNKYIVAHPETGKAETPYESHHFPNVGLRRRSEGQDTLREQQIGFIKGVMEEFREKIAAIFEQEDIIPHANPGMNTLDSRLLALGEAMWSNFVRGAAFYRYRRGEQELDKYRPRRSAADAIDAVKAKYGV